MNKNLTPMIFVDHGSPMRVIEENNVNNILEELWQKLSDVKWVLIISAHYLKDWNFITTKDKLETVYDFYWFPDKLYDLSYDVENDIDLIKDLQEIYKRDVFSDNEFGIDHWAWSVVYKMFPNKDKKITLLSVNDSLNTSEIFEFWKKLKSLREKWYLIIWTGNILHNFSEIDFVNKSSKFSWAEDFNKSFKDKIENRDFKDLINYKNLENYQKAFKTLEHYKPLIYLLWAVDEIDDIRYLNYEILNGALSNNLITFWKI